MVSTPTRHIPDLSTPSANVTPNRDRNRVPAGNITDKDNLRNPISRHLVRQFDQTLMQCLDSVGPSSLHEVGCGEGRLTRLLAKRFGIPMRATDVDADLIAHGQSSRTSGVTFVQRSIYDLRPSQDRADAIVCCEVLEHVAHPVKALGALRRLAAPHYVLSVPREPLWRILNVCRGRYWHTLGNTPGHLNHWSTKGFLRCLSNCDFEPSVVRTPLPWTMVLGTFKS